MKKKVLSFFSVILLVCPSLIGSGQVFADSAESEQTQEQENQMTNEVETSDSDSEENNNETEYTEQTEGSTDSFEKSNQEGVLQKNTEDTDGNEVRNRNTDNSKSLSDDIASGTFGTAPWRIDQGGILHIESGVLEYNGPTSPSPWIDWSNDIQKIVFDGKVSTSDGAARLFSALKNVKVIENLSNLDTSKATTMSWLFQGMTSLTALDLSGFDTSKVTDMSVMFEDSKSIQSLDLSSFDTSKVTNMSAMFSSLQGLTNLDISHFNTSNVIYMNAMFAGLTNITSLDLSSFDTSKVRDMSDMFSSLKRLTNLDISHFNTSNVTRMSFMFADLKASLDLSTLNTSNVTDMSGMFYELQTPSLDLSTFNTSNVTNMRSMFSYSSGNNITGLKEINLSSFDTSNVTDMTSMFQSAGGLTGLDLSSFNTSNVTNMDQMFDFGPRYFKELKLGLNFKFSSDAGLNDIDYSPTRKWINVGSGTVTNPNGENIWTSAELMTNYDGSKDADTYVWQRVPAGDITIEYVDQEGTKLHDNQTIDGNVGDAYDTSTDRYKLVIDGYLLDESHLPTNATGTISAQPQTVRYVYKR
ncbi:TPA: BspA family leucine-rich repeat surface protein, partial [Listeria monocytogenes]|nr:BspA family leucine-rich repeat surface protein [Listeria monocytogenes]